MQTPVSREMLIGYRKPTQAECDRIWEQFEPEMKRSIKARSFIGAFLGVCAGGALLETITRFQATALKEGMLYLALFAFFFWLTYMLRAWRKEDKLVLARVAEGDFRVLDCHPWDASFQTDRTGKATVKIYTELGQYCDFDFYLSRSLVSRCKREPDTRLLLMYCEPKTYQLFGEL